MIPAGKDRVKNTSPRVMRILIKVFIGIDVFRCI
jgi:hypothetical protein